jgi:uncharacterized radical SAM superfamily Fe-S cluster-containing enzyme
MRKFGETVSLCPVCGKDSFGFYEEKPDGIFLNTECREHGLFCEQVEKDNRLFREGYEQEYKKSFHHLVLPVTYRCNLKCSYCYTLSNTPVPLPGDRTSREISGICDGFDGGVTFIGGEPTVRDDAPELIRNAKRKNGDRKVSISTNGQRLADIGYLQNLRENGLDFVFLSCNDIAYDKSCAVYRNKITALDNCLKLDIPVWLQRTVDAVRQLNSLADILVKYRRIIFAVSVRSAKALGLYHPKKPIFVSDMLEFFKKDRDYAKGTNPFNRYINLEDKKVKICSWVNDVKRLDPIDYHYVISTNEIIPFHRGMKLDEVMLMAGSAAGKPS